MWIVRNGFSSSAKRGAPVVFARLFALMCSAMGAACGDASTPDGAPVDLETSAPLFSATSDAGRFDAEVHTSPSPPRRGVNEVLLVFRDAEGRLLDGLRLQVVPWMPSHAHGAAVEPTVTPRARGAYAIENVVFHMAGRWELKTTLVGDDDRLVVAFDIP